MCVLWVLKRHLIEVSRQAMRKKGLAEEIKCKSDNEAK